MIGIFLKKIYRSLRVVSTGLSFFAFMVWGFVLGMFLFPLLGLIYRDPIKRKEKFNIHLRRAWRVFLRFMEILKAFGKIEVQGLENFSQNKAQILICNHPTLVDIVALGSRIENFNCIIKMSLWKQPFFGSVIRGSDFIPNVGSDQFIELCKRGFEHNRPLIVFPQGSRTPVDAPVVFQRGTAQVAVRTNVPIVPVIVTCEPPALAKGVAWYKIPEKPARLVLRVGSPLQIPEEINNEKVIPVKVRALNAFLEQWFELELKKQKK